MAQLASLVPEHGEAVHRLPRFLQLQVADESGGGLMWRDLEPHPASDFAHDIHGGLDTLGSALRTRDVEPAAPMSPADREPANFGEWE